MARISGFHPEERSSNLLDSTILELAYYPLWAGIYTRVFIAHWASGDAVAPSRLKREFDSLMGDLGKE